MFERFKDDWEQLKASEPGHRFQDRYYRRHSREGGSGNKYLRTVTVGIGILIIGFGGLLLLFPGPGWATIVLGIALIAGESLSLAKVLDVLELIIRKLIGKQRAE